ncbi:hypothetical protein [Amycolatopsis sp. DSM 110486]|uniref:hypothetical protein n=1 Tax=Amycolatopsis sp. DSM 110486 TaxID=2865832 RepID=UPI001C6A4C20|nr:hypothetical protein [Amycolatopsis sp. DSM 110486]QYN23153.1 hypothetical protein K1T34_12245 [Amycolatopsis sp. DSM 110486]
MSYFTERRDAAREDKRLQLEHQRELTRLQAEENRVSAAEARRDAAQARGRRTEALARAARWCGAHVVDLLIYPLMLVSAAITIPGVAEYGRAHLGGEVGGLLPILSEWGMIAFSVALHVSRIKYPDRPVWALQLGLWVFAGYGFTISVLRGVGAPGGGLDIGVVMGLVSVAGVIAHQMVSAAPRRSGAERAARRTARAEQKAGRAAERTRRAATERVETARRAAIKSAVAEVDQDGTARLVFAPGRYALRGGKLHPAAVAGLPVPDPTPLGDSVADEATAYLAGLHYRRLDSTTATGPAPDADGAGVGTLDPPPPADAPRADDAGDPPANPKRPSPARRVGGRKTVRSTIPEPKRRGLDELREEFKALLQNPPQGFRPAVIGDIRKTLRCGQKYAVALCNEYRAAPHEFID